MFNGLIGQIDETVQFEISNFGFEMQDSSDCAPGIPAESKG